MKTIKISVLGLICLLVAVSATTYTEGNKTKAMSRKSDGTYVVNTTKIAKSVKGFAGQTPLKIYIKSGKVVKVEALPNNETAGIFSKVTRDLLNKWNGMKVEKAAENDIDGVSGATYSSKAVKQNVKIGAKYYLDETSKSSSR